MEFKNILENFNESRFFSLVEKTHEYILFISDYGLHNELCTHENGFRITRTAWESSKQPIVKEIKHAILKQLELAIDNENLKFSNIGYDSKDSNEFADTLALIKIKLHKHEFLKFCEPITKQIDSILSEIKAYKKSSSTNKEGTKTIHEERIICNLRTSVLGKLINDIRILEIPGSDKKCIDNDPSSLSRIIHKIFIQANGESYSLDSLASYIEAKPKDVKRLKTIQLRFED